MEDKATCATHHQATARVQEAGVQVEFQTAQSIVQRYMFR
jgi:hypothetical protein